MNATTHSLLRAMSTPARGRPRIAGRGTRNALGLGGGLTLLALALALMTPVAASAVPADRAAGLEAYLQIWDRIQVPQAWTGSVATCTVGTQSAESIAATLYSVNALRDFAGVAPVAFDPALNRKALAAALMMDAKGALSHTPGTDWPCYSSEGAEGAGASNLSGGSSAVGAILGWINDSFTPSLGHRFPILSPLRATFGTGSTGGFSSALYVFGALKPSPTIPAVLAWPPPGHVPWPLIQGTWSAALHTPGTMDASGAQVRVSIDGRAATVTGVTDMGAGYGSGRQLKWDVGLVTGDRDADRTVEVIIDGVKVNGIARQYRYTIQTIRADRPLGTTVTGSRTANTATISWLGAAERGVPVTGYRVEGFDGVGPAVIAQTVGPTVREVTASYTAPTKTLRVQVTPLSRLGNGNTGFGVNVPPPTPPPGTQPAPGTQPPPTPVTQPSSPGAKTFGAPPFASKLEVERATVLRSQRRLSVLAPITGRASGDIRAAYRAAGRTERFDTKIDTANRRVRINRKIPSSQARMGTGILTLTYGGDSDTQPQQVRLRAATGKARLDASRPRISGARLTASGTLSTRARGVVRLQLLYEPAGQSTRTLQYTTRISDGRYRFDEQLPAGVINEIASRRGTVHSYTLFTGYLARRIRGEMRSYEVLRAPTG